MKKFTSALKRSMPLAIAIIVLVSIAAPLSSFIQTDSTSPVMSITFGAIPSGSGGLVYVAQEQGFFSANRLDVTVKDYATGVATTDALLKGEVDIAWAAEFPFVRRAFARENMSIIAALSRFSDQFLFGRKDRGIENVADLKGKTIGLPRNTIAEFYLARFLELNGANVDEVSLVDVQPAQSMDALGNGSVDAVVTWEPYSSRIKGESAGALTIWPVQSSQPGFGVIISKNDWIDEHSDMIKRFLKSLDQAESYLTRNEEAAKDIVQKRVNYDDAFIEVFWSENRFLVSLDQSLVAAMEDEARWMINSGLTQEKTVPDFADYIYLDGLQAIKPGAVKIIR